MKHPPKLLAISPPCSESVNRAVYRRLATHYGIDVYLVIPMRKKAEAAHKQCAPITDEPFEAAVLEMSGRHPRLERVHGLQTLLRDERPSHIIMEADPATLLARDVLQITHRTSAKAACLSVENRRRNFSQEAFQALREGKLSIAFGGLLASWLLRTARPHIHKIFTVCQDGGVVMSELGFADRITQIPLGFDPDLFYPQPVERVAATRQRLGLHTPTVAYFGRLSPEKGIAILIDALAMIKDIEWQFLIDKFALYPSPYETLLEQRLRELNIMERVVYFDAAHTEIPDYMNAADIVVLPSVSNNEYKEQYGRVIPEAMACGKVVVGSDNGAIPELIDDCGYIFPEGDVSALAGILRDLLTTEPQNLNQLRTQAAERARSQLSTTRQAQIWYEWICGQ